MKSFRQLIRIQIRIQSQLSLILGPVSSGLHQAFSFFTFLLRYIYIMFKVWHVFILYTYIAHNKIFVMIVTCTL